MGYVAHNAIVVTSWDLKALTAAYDQAAEMGLISTDVEASPINSYWTFLVVPDGSKEGWNDSELGDHRRLLFKDWLRSQRYEDGSSALEWAEVRYGSDDRDAEVVDHQWKDRLHAS